VAGEVELIITLSFRYNEHLKEARKIGAKKGISTGFSIGFVFFLFFSIDAVAFW
jgi:hypothetical protein